MLFSVDGVYRHKLGFTITIKNGEVFLSPDHPLSIRVSEMFDKDSWEKVE